MIARPLEDFITGQKRIEFDNDGEYYRVSCPFCTDTRHRLYINHMYGRTDFYGRRSTYLARCFNETLCMHNQDNVEALWDHIISPNLGLEDARIKQGQVVSGSKKVFEMPGACTRLDKLRLGHKAVQYVLDRNFDPKNLGSYYKFHYCSDSFYYLAIDRITIPIFNKGVLRGWQCRYVGELPWKDKKKKKDLPPKYFNAPGMDKTSFVQNMDRAKHWHTGVGVEGWFDVVSFGPMAMPAMGDSWSLAQQRSVIRHFRDGAFVLLFDPEALEEENVRKMSRHFKRVLGKRYAEVLLPEGTDPGSLDRSFLREFIKGEAESQGVKVQWRKKDAQNREEKEEVEAL